MRYRTYSRNGDTGLAVRDGAVWRDLGAVDLTELIAAGRAADPKLAEGAPELAVPTGDDRLRRTPATAVPEFETRMTVL